MKTSLYILALALLIPLAALVTGIVNPIVVKNGQIVTYKKVYFIDIILEDRKNKGAAER